ncbi:MAG: F0F1 ATP synthase subunit epsilon [Bacillota bacterium]|nr:F0F1 ATP synthase subunit epsilon [Bacillota bacterium]
MANSFELEIISPSEVFYRGEVEEIIVKTPEGYEGFMAKHSWTCKLLDVGKIKIRPIGTPEGQWVVASSASGFIDVKDKVVIYVDAVEWDRGPERRRSRTIHQE